MPACSSSGLGIRIPWELPIATMRALTELERGMVDTMYLRTLSRGKEAIVAHAGGIEPTTARLRIGRMRHLSYDVVSSTPDVPAQRPNNLVVEWHAGGL